MTTLNESFYATEYLINEMEGDIARDTVTLIAGQNLKAGTVLGLITASGKYTQHAPAAVDGSQNAVAILYADVNAVADTKCVAHTRLCEVNGKIIIWPTGISAPNKVLGIASLATKNILVR